MSSESIDAVSGFCLRIALTSYERLAPRGRILQTSVALAERDALLLAWAMSNDMDEIAQAVVGRHWGMHQSETVESTIKFGQISGSIDARETLLQQHLTADLSLFVVNEVVPTKASLDQRNVVAWALKVACNQISKALHKDQCHGKPKQFLEERLAVQKSALAMPVLRGALSGRLGVSLPSEAAINNARRSKVGLHPKAGGTLRIYQGLQRLAPFAVRRIVSESVMNRLESQDLLALAGGLAMAEALSIASGHPLKWNSSMVSDMVMATVGPFSVRWHKPINVNADAKQATVSINDTQTGSCISFIRCAFSFRAAFEDEAIRLATESLVTSCRLEAGKGPRFEETPLANCAVVMRRLFKFQPEAPKPDRLIITEFNEMSRGRLLGLARRVCDRALTTESHPHLDVMELVIHRPAERRAC